MDFHEIQWKSDRYRDEVELRDQMLRAPLGIKFDPAEIEAEQHQWHFGIFAEYQMLIACVVAVPLSPTLVKLRQMAVEESFQRRGIGTRLLIETEQCLFRRGVREVELNARETATAFYRKLGYQIVGERFIEVTIPHFKMTKQLSAE